VTQPSDLVDEYRAYLARFEKSFGACEFGESRKHPEQKGRMVKKLRLEEFEAKYLELFNVEQAYKAIVERGDTINDMIVRLMRERADDLLLPRPV
jgi:hypothetical protein